MPRGQHRRYWAKQLVVACALLLATPLANGEDQALLIIEGDRIGVIEAPDPIAFPGRFLDAYYALLPDDVHSELQALRQQLRRLIPDYNVAFTAADSAELTDVKDAMDTLMASVHALHADYFTAAVAVELNRAFDAVITLVGADC